MTGRILVIGEKESIPSKSSDKTFNKRVLVLNCSRSYYGEDYENFPSFEFTGKHIDDPLAFKVGDIVTVSFVIQGNRYKKGNEPEKFFNTIAGYKIEAYTRTGSTTQHEQVTQPSEPQNSQNKKEPQNNQNIKEDDLPF